MRTVVSVANIKVEVSPAEFLKQRCSISSVPSPRESILPVAVVAVISRIEPPAQFGESPPLSITPPEPVPMMRIAPPFILGGFAPSFGIVIWPAILHVLLGMKTVPPPLLPTDVIAAFSAAVSSVVPSHFAPKAGSVTSDQGFGPLNVSPCRDAALNGKLFKFNGPLMLCCALAAGLATIACGYCISPEYSGVP